MLQKGGQERREISGNRPSGGSKAEIRWQAEFAGSKTVNINYFDGERLVATRDTVVLYACLSLPTINKKCRTQKTQQSPRLTNHKRLGTRQHGNYATIIYLNAFH